MREGGVLERCVTHLLLLEEEDQLSPGELLTQIAAGMRGRVSTSVLLPFIAFLGELGESPRNAMKRVCPTNPLSLPGMKFIPGRIRNRPQHVT